MKRRIGFSILAGLGALCGSIHAQGPFIPGGLDTAGVTNVVADTLVWYSTDQLEGHPYPGYVTTGPVDPLSQIGPVAYGNANWEPYLSVLGESTFLVEAGMFADDGSWQNPGAWGGRPNQRFIVVFQPAAGGSPVVGEMFYDDNGQPYRLHTLLRQRSPGGRVAGDPRPGATNFLTAGMGSLWYGKLWYNTDYFNSDGRFNTDFPLYATGFGSSCNQDCNAATAVCASGYPSPCADVEAAIAQTFALDPATLSQIPLSKARDALYDSCCTNQVPSHVAAQMSNKNYLNRFGGDVIGLDDGNFVCVLDDATGFFGGSANAFQTVATIFRPDGTVAKTPWLVDTREVWANVAAYRGGFCIRVQSSFYFFDNAGNLTASNAVSSSAVGFDTGRGDGTRIASNVRSRYVYLAGPVGIDGGTANAVGLGIWDARTGAFVISAIITDTDPSVTAIDRVNLAVDGLDRVTVAFAMKPDKTQFTQWQIAARVMRFDGASISFLTPSFFPFVSHDSDPTSLWNYVTANPSVAMTTKYICIAGKGTVNSVNNPTLGPDTAPETTVYTVINNPAPFVPGNADSVGLTHIVPDAAVWYDTLENEVKTGPIDTLAEAVPLDNWEPYIGLLGDSTFLVGLTTFANDGQLKNQNYVVVFQPAVGGPAKIGYHFYSDAGFPTDAVPFKGQVNLSRQNGNPQRVAGDKRYGAINYITAGEASLGQLSDFQSDSRWANNPIYQAVNRYVCEQVFSLDTAGLTPTPLTLAWDWVYGAFQTATPPLAGNVPQLQRTGGKPIGLDNGNFVVMIDDKTGYSSASGEVTTFSIITPTGTIVKAATLVDAHDIWDNITAFRGGFAIRVHNLLYFFDNGGEVQHTVDINTSSTLTFGTGREDASRIGSDIRSHYVYLAGQTPEAGQSHNPVSVAVWDARTGEFVTSATVTDTDPAIALTDRVDVAADAYDRFCVVYSLQATASFTKRQVAARVMKFDGARITPLTPAFFPFVNSESTPPADPNLAMETFHASVAMTPREICIAAKGHINSTDNPANGADSALQTQVYTVLSHPEPVPAPQPMIVATRSTDHVVISYQWEAGLFRLQSCSTLPPVGAWTDVTPQPALDQVGDTFQMTVPVGSKNTYFRLVR